MTPTSAVAVHPKISDVKTSQTDQAVKKPIQHDFRHKPQQTSIVVNPEASYSFDDLIEAVWHSNINLVDRLLEQGVDINRRDGSGLTPLIVAIENDDLNMSKHLLDKGADPNVPRKSDGYSPLVIAKTASRPNAQLIELLNTSGARNPFK